MVLAGRVCTRPPSIAVALESIRSPCRYMESTEEHVRPIEPNGIELRP